MRNSLNSQVIKIDPATRELIEELAVNHGLAVGPQDPVLAMHTVAIRAIHTAGQTMQAELKTLHEEITKAQAQVLEEHRRQVEKDATTLVARVTSSVSTAVDKEKIASHIRHEVDSRLSLLFSRHCEDMNRFQWNLCLMVIGSYVVSALPYLFELYQRIFS